MSMFGASRDEVVRAYLAQVTIRDLVLAAGAEQRGLDKQLPTSQLLSRALSGAALRKTRTGYPSAAAIPMEDVRAYYDENRSRFDSPERINVWRILCKTREEAGSVLDAARREPTIAKYNDLAREHSIDKATNLRGGNLGFVGPDGASNEAGVKVDEALVKAAQTVKDGELVGHPVAEGNAFAVVWRRGTVPANRRTVEEASAQIRAALFRERSEKAEKKLIDELRAKNLKEEHDNLLGIIELRPFDAGLGPRSPAGAIAPRPSH
jgi:peptidyl-prolyl cis-trans isomerase C